jgi:hypothetical protein
MFRATWFSEYKGKVGTLRFCVDPRKHGLGHYRDTSGRQWDINAIIGEHVCARPVDQHPSYYGTHPDDTSNGFHRWIPYRVEVVGAV